MTKAPVALACLIALAPGPGIGLVRAGTKARPVRAFLCDTAEHAIAFADLVAAGEGEEIARDRVGRIASADACGRWAGIAAIDSESVALKDGRAYKLTAFRFREDQKVAWRADTTFSPTGSAWDL